jgi:hypothetical protein
MPEVRSVDPTAGANSVRGKIGNKTFAQPLPEEKKTTQGGNNRDVGAKTRWLYRELQEAASLGVSAQLFYSIMDDKGAFFTKTRSSAAPRRQVYSGAAYGASSCASGGASADPGLFSSLSAMMVDENAGQEL